MIVGYWIIFFILSLMAALFSDLMRIMNYFYKVFPGWLNTNYERVKLIWFSSVILFLVFITIYGFISYAHPQIKELNLVIDKSKGKFENLTIVAVSDIHIGNIVQRERLSRWIELINNQDPDIILLLGDIFDRNFNPDESQNIIEELKKIRSKFGVYAILGNHEYYFCITKAKSYLENSGIVLLRDSSVIIDSCIVIIGRDDATNIKRKAIDKLLTGSDISMPLILLNHQPSDLHGSVINNIDLQLSGHLHNGQIYPYGVILSRLWELSYGYRNIGNTQFYVTSGLGIRIVHLRIGTRSEILNIHLKSENSLIDETKELRSLPIDSH
jgi:uncharacterized protein